MNRGFRLYQLTSDFHCRENILASLQIFDLTRYLYGPIHRCPYIIIAILQTSAPIQTYHHSHPVSSLAVRRMSLGAIKDFETIDGADSPSLGTAAASIFHCRQAKLA